MRKRKPEMNNIILIGNVGQDAQFRQARSGSPFTSFNLATNENYQNKSGEWLSETTWHKIKIIGRNAERASSTIKKGDKVLIQGKIETYEKDGVTFLEIKAFTFQKLNKDKELEIGSATGSKLDPWR